MQQNWGKLRELDTILAVFRLGNAHARPEEGWLRAIRRALGVPAKVLARRLKVKPAQVYVLEKEEATGRIRMTTLRRMAEALGCEVVYAFVPHEGSLEAMVARRREAEERMAEAKRLEDHRIRAAQWRSREWRAETRKVILQTMARAGLAPRMVVPR